MQTTGRVAHVRMDSEAHDELVARALLAPLYIEVADVGFPQNADLLFRRVSFSFHSLGSF